MGHRLPLFLYHLLKGQSEGRLRARLNEDLRAKRISQSGYDHRFSANLPKRLSGEVIWMHMASQGSVQPAVELMARLLEDRPDAIPLFTKHPEIETQMVPSELTEVQEIPEELPAITARFFGHWQPDILIWFGGRFRPQILQTARDNGLPCLSIDSDDGLVGLEGFHFVPRLTAETMDHFDHVIAATELSSRRWNRLGIEFARIEVLGRLGEGGSPLSIDEDRMDALSGLLGTRSSWFATKLQLGELSDILKTHRAVLRRSHRALLALSMARPEDCAQARNMVDEFGLQVRWAVDETFVGESDQVLIVPQTETTLWHRLAPISFLGSSLSNSGGTDPFVAAAMGSAIVHGANVANFSASYDRLAAAKASRSVKNGKELRIAIEELLSPDQAAIQAQAAWDVATAGAEATDRVSDLAQDILDLRERSPA